MNTDYGRSKNLGIPGDFEGRNKEAYRITLCSYSMVPIKRTVFLLTVYGMKNTVHLIGTLEYLFIMT